jgi:hypothetical protein
MHDVHITLVMQACVSAAVCNTVARACDPVPCNIRLTGSLRYRACDKGSCLHYYGGETGDCLHQRAVLHHCNHMLPELQLRGSGLGLLLPLPLCAMLVVMLHLFPCAGRWPLDEFDN